MVENLSIQLWNVSNGDTTWPCPPALVFRFITDIIISNLVSFFCMLNDSSVELLRPQLKHAQHSQERLVKSRSCCTYRLQNAHTTNVGLMHTWICLCKNHFWYLIQSTYILLLLLSHTVKIKFIFNVHCMVSGTSNVAACFQLNSIIW